VDAEAVEFQRQLAEVARADDGLKQVGARAEVAVQKLQLARRWAHRAVTIAISPLFADDPDFAFASMYQAFQDAADALLCAHGWRPGGERAHQRTFQLAAAGLYPVDAEAAMRLRDNERTLRQARREIAYDRTDVVSRRDLDEILALAALVLPALARRTCAVIGLAPVPAEFAEWAIPAGGITSPPPPGSPARP
jgi:hypothetical protein